MMQAILVDDEELSLLYLQKKLNDFPSIEVVNTYTNPQLLLNDIQKEKISFDVAFLDIQMFGLDGIHLAESILSINSTIHIVFISGYSEYAVEAFDLNSIDYLLKPVTTGRLEKTLARLMALQNKTQDKPTSHIPKSTLMITGFHEFHASYHRTPLHFKTAKVKELFALLLSVNHQPIHRDTMIKKLWPEQEYKKAKVHLHTCLSHLRKTLNAIGYENSITFSNGSYTLSLDPIDYDLSKFDQLYENLQRIDQTNIDAALEAIALYKGPYLDMNGYSWAYEKASEYHEKIMRLLHSVIQYYEQNNPAEALVYLQFQRTLDPYLDESIKRSMQILIQFGNRSDALKLYREHENLLRSDLDITPSLELAKLHHEILFL